MYSLLLMRFRLSGVNSIYHNNVISTWLVNKDGSVDNVRLGRIWLAWQPNRALTVSPALASDRPFKLGKIASTEEVAAGTSTSVRTVVAHPSVWVTPLTARKSTPSAVPPAMVTLARLLMSWPALVGGEAHLTRPNLPKTTGSYWPYASTMYDYIYRAMPFGEAQSLTPDETLPNCCFLTLHEMTSKTIFDVSHENIGTIEMPNRHIFMPDPRPDAQPVSSELCMTNLQCFNKHHWSVRDIDVTPESESQYITGPTQEPT